MDCCVDNNFYLSLLAVTIIYGYFETLVKETGPAEMAQFVSTLFPIISVRSDNC